MKPEAIVAIGFIAGALTGIAVMTWVVFFPLPYWNDDAHFANFANFSKSSIFTDMGESYPVYCPEPSD